MLPPAFSISFTHTIGALLISVLTVSLGCVGCTSSEESRLLQRPHGVNKSESAQRLKWKDASALRIKFEDLTTEIVDTPPLLACWLEFAGFYHNPLPRSIRFAVFQDGRLIYRKEPDDWLSTTYFTRVDPETVSELCAVIRASSSKIRDAAEMHGQHPHAPWIRLALNSPDVCCIIESSELKRPMQTILQEVWAQMHELAYQVVEKSEKAESIRPCKVESGFWDNLE